MQNAQTSNRKGIVIDLLFGTFLILLGLGGGYFYAQSQPKQWKATTILEAPKVADLGNYFALYNTYHLVQHDGKADPQLENSVTQAAYAEFKRAINAQDARKQFLTDNALVKQIADVHYLPLNEIVYRIDEKLQFDEASNTLSLSLANPEQAAKILTQFLAFQQGRVRTALNNELIAKWKFLFQNVKQSAEANLGESWQGKLNLMRSVQPLDNQLVAYHVVQQPVASALPELPERLKESLGIGGVVGMLLALLFAVIRRK